MENLTWNINSLTVYIMHFSWLVADELEWFRVLVLYLSADVGEHPLCSKTTAFMEYVKNRALNLNGIIISLTFSLARVFIIHKENVFRIHIWILRGNLSLGWGIIDSGLFPGWMRAKVFARWLNMARFQSKAINLLSTMLNRSVGWVLYISGVISSLLCAFFIIYWGVDWGTVPLVKPPKTS